MRKTLLAILLVAAVIRFIGIYPGYNQFHPDEQMSYSTAAAMIEEGTLIPQGGYAVKFAYPYLVPLINYFFFKNVFVPLGWANYFLTNIGKIVDGFIHFPLSVEDKRRILQLEIVGIRQINTLFWGRIVTVLFGVGNVFLTYLIASKIANKKAGLTAAVIIAFNFRHVSNSHIALPDIYNSFFLLLSVLASITLYQSPSKKSYALAGVAAGLSFNVKFQFFAILPLLVSHTLVVLEEGKYKLNDLVNKKILLSLLFIPLFLVLLNPFHIIYFEKTLIQVTDVALKYGMGTKLLNLFPIWYLYNIDLGPTLFILCLVGIVYCALKYPKYSLIILPVSILQAFLFFYYSTGGFHVRNIIPMTPLLIIFASLFLEAVRRKVPVLIFVMIIAAAIYVPARNSLINSYYYTKPWNFNRLSEWLFKNPLDEPVAANPTDPPTGAPLLVKTEFNQGSSFSMAEHLENGAGYALMNTDWIGNGFYYWMVYYPGTIQEKWHKPVEKLRNTYQGLAIEEMLDYQIFAAIKPWQAPEANLILVEFPDWDKIEMVRIAETRGHVVTQTGAGKVAIASLPVKEKHLYKIKAVLESKLPLASNYRDGFLRVDVGSTSCVSARLYEGSKTTKEVYCFAKPGSDNIDVSLNAENAGNEIGVRDLVVEESVEIIDTIPSKYPYIEDNVELELIYQNSQANL